MIKYLNANSLKYLLKKIIIGVNVIKFNSIIIHIENHELLEIVINGEINKIGIM